MANTGAGEIKKRTAKGAKNRQDNYDAEVEKRKMDLTFLFAFLGGLGG